MKPGRGALVLPLFALGVVQMAGDLAGFRPLSGIGAATMASPAPRVFSAVRGYETYTTRFFLEWQDPDPRGSREVARLELTSDVYARLRGPYNRRNIYGAVLSYGPVLPPPLRDPVLRHALCGDRPLLRELGVDPGPGHRLALRYQPRPGIPAAPVPLVIEAPCEGRALP